MARKTYHHQQFLDWPDLTGARTDKGAICIGLSKTRSRSKKGKTRLKFIALEPIAMQRGDPIAAGEEFEIAAHEVSWARDHKTIAILTEGLREIVNRKVDVPFDRGAVGMQIVSGTGGPRAYMYEVVRDSLWPRYWWPMPYNMSYQTTIKWLIWMETYSPDLVGIPDTRRPAEVEYHDFWDKDRRGLRFFTNDLGDWVRDVQEKFGPSVRK